jgi:hypothetical protein
LPTLHLIGQGLLRVVDLVLGQDEEVLAVRARDVQFLLASSVSE